MDEILESQIEIVRLNRMDGDGALKAFCDIILYDTLIVRGLRVIKGKNGLFVGMPRERSKDGKWYEIVRPVSRDVKQVIEKVVLEAYSA